MVLEKKDHSCTEWKVYTVIFKEAVNFSSELCHCISLTKFKTKFILIVNVDKWFGRDKKQKKHSFLSCKSNIKSKSIKINICTNMISACYFYMLAELWSIRCMHYYTANKTIRRCTLLYEISKRKHSKLLFLFAHLLVLSAVLSQILMNCSLWSPIIS
jgi:hypothetical protein